MKLYVHFTLMNNRKVYNHPLKKIHNKLFNKFLFTVMNNKL